MSEGQSHAIILDFYYYCKTLEESGKSPTANAMNEWMTSSFPIVLHLEQAKETVIRRPPKKA